MIRTRTQTFREGEAPAEPSLIRTARQEPRPPKAIGKEQESMASLLKRTIFLFAGFLVLQTASGAFAQGRMGMMMARQPMAMNAGMMGQFNPNLVPSLTPGLGTNWNWMSNIYGNRSYGYPGYGGGDSGYSGNSPPDYSGGGSSSSNSYRRQRSYVDEPSPLSHQ